MKCKITNELSDVVNYTNNVRYCDFRLTNFWYIVNTNRGAALPLREEDAQLKPFNDEYIKINGKPPLSCLRVKQHGCYTIHKSHAIYDDSEPGDMKVKKFKLNPEKHGTLLDVNVLLKNKFENMKENPDKVLLIPNKEQEPSEYLCKDKKGIPMYEDTQEDLMED